MLWHVNINILLQKPVMVSLHPEADVDVGMIVSVQTVVNVAQRTKDVVVYQVDSVGVGIPVNVPLNVDVEVVENPTNHSNTVLGKATCNKFA
jgi:uncharacterized membrane protein